MTPGRLRIYLGAAPGVGKTMAMLSEGHRRLERGTDVVVGLVETHGRTRTAAAAAGLEVVPTREVTHRGTTLREMDVEAVLARAPEVALVDELAHTNAPGSRHAKRWEDVRTLLAAGIDVISTVNVQHLESLNDVVESITGIRQQETVPDEVVRTADQIELVDMSPHALRRRMAHGNVYGADRVDAALANYFREGNLTALRELSLLWLADRVDEGLERYRRDQGITSSWPARERVVVAVTGGPESAALVRRGAQIAARGAGGELLVAHVTPADGLIDARLESIGEIRTLVAELGGTFHTVAGDDVSTAIIDFARGVNARQIVLGASRRTWWQALRGRGVGSHVVEGAGADIDTVIVTHEQAHRGRSRRRPGRVARGRWLSGWLLATVGTAVLTGLLAVTRASHDLPLEVLLFLALTVGSALAGGFGPAVVSALLGSLSLNWFFTEPVGTLTITNPQNAAAVVVFLLVAVSVSSAVHLSDRRAAAARLAQREALALERSAQTLLGEQDPLATLLEQVADLFHLTSAGLVRRQSVREPWQVVAALPGFHVDDLDRAAVLAPVDDTTTLALFGPVLAADERRLVSAFAAHAEAVLRRADLLEQARRAGALARDNRARTALLSAVSHDLRTPLAGIKAAVSALRQPGASFSEQDEADLLETIEESSDRLTTLVANLLDISRLQSGVVVAQLSEGAVLETIRRTVSTVSAPARVRVIGADDLPLALYDEVLLDRVLANVVENALQHSGGRQEVVVKAYATGDRLQVRVVDRGSGVPDSAKAAIFAPFQRLDDAPRGSGVGLGLAVARGLMETMEGTIVAEDTPGGGLTIVLELPRAPHAAGPGVAADDVSPGGRMPA
ncbi:ATP-binding protein [Pedococcus sp. KACC 23699]|uniref:histidine kinase n=1 Tax=Pedococcus sp. KACC 23699 TaxID=3149228 RepID=A0AAU7JUJ0_9MICO